MLINTKLVDIFISCIILSCETTKIPASILAKAKEGLYGWRIAYLSIPRNQYYTMER